VRSQAPEGIVAALLTAPSYGRAPRISFWRLPTDGCAGGRRRDRGLVVLRDTDGAAAANAPRRSTVRAPPALYKSWTATRAGRGVAAVLAQVRARTAAARAGLIVGGFWPGIRGGPIRTSRRGYSTRRPGKSSAGSRGQCELAEDSLPVGS